MAIFKCKMCGGTLEVTDGSSVCECIYCGTRQTIPTVKDDITINLFNRANNLRLKNEFDKAEAIYEKIVQEDDSNAEAHWGIVLCKYGIEYVDDPLTLKKIPTCHRTLYDAISVDPDYQAAIDYSDPIQQSIYETEARAIDRIQKDILSIVKNEQPFDVFICYKETDENGKRTIDSVIANDIYYQLTQEGFKVFYAAITLEDKLGQEYEPYIFAALNSAKVMLSIGTKPEYFTSVWVKNEWSRFLSLMKTDRSKLLIPCYRDMDAYDLPVEFSHLQAQDMSKIGFINDVVRGIKKVIKKDEPKQKAAPVIQNINTNSNVEALLKRGFMSLEDHEWQEADTFFEDVLNNDPENGEAYLGKLLCDLRIDAKDKLSSVKQSFEDNKNYQRAVKFGNDSTKNLLGEFIARIEKEKTEKKNEGIYKWGLELMKFNTLASLKSAFSSLKTIPDYRDVPEKLEEIAQRINDLQDDSVFGPIYEDAAKYIDKDNEESLKKAIDLLSSIAGYKSSKQMIEDCTNRINEIREEKENSEKESKYKIAIELIAKNNVNALESAIAVFEGITLYKDSVQKIEECKEQIKQLHIQEENKKYGPTYNAAMDLLSQDTEKSLNEAIKMFEKTLDFKDSYEKICECRERLDRLNEIKIYEKNEKDYNRALELMSKKTNVAIVEAMGLLTAIASFKDSSAKNDECRIMLEDLRDKEEERRKERIYDEAMENVARNTNESLTKAIDLFTSVFDYRDSMSKIAECKNQIESLENKAEEERKDIIYNEAIIHVAANQEDSLNKAIELFSSISDYKDSSEKIEECKKQIEDLRIQEENNRKEAIYNNGLELIELNTENSLTNAIEIFKTIEDYKDSTGKIVECNVKIEELRTQEEQKKNEPVYSKAISLVELNTKISLNEAIILFESIINYKDSETKIEECRNNISYLEEKEEQERLGGIYSNAMQLMKDNTVTSLNEAINVFATITDYKDSSEKISECQNIIDNILAQEENNRKEKIYSDALEQMETDTEQSLTKAAELFISISDYKDSLTKSSECEERIADLKIEEENNKKQSVYEEAQSLFEENSDESLNKAMSLFASIAGYRDSVIRTKDCEDQIRSIKEVEENKKKQSVYERAEALISENTIDSLNEAINLFGSIYDYSDSQYRIAECNELIDTIHETAENNRKQDIYDRAMSLMSKDTDESIKEARDLFVSIVGFKDSESKVLECDERAEQLKNQRIINEKESIYQRAEELLLSKEIKQINEAVVLFASLGEFEDASKKHEECKDMIRYLLDQEELSKKEDIYNRAIMMAEENNEESLMDAIDLFGTISDYKDSDQQIEKYNKALIQLNIQNELQRKEDLYIEANELLSDGTYSSLNNAINLFSTIPDHKDSLQLIEECNKQLSDLAIKEETKKKLDIYDKAVANLNSNMSNRINVAVSQFESIKDFGDSSEMIEECNRRIEENKAKKQEQINQIKKKLPLLVCAILLVGAICVFAKVKPFEHSLPVSEDEQIEKEPVENNGITEMVFGNYHGSINWKIIDEDEDNYLLISEYILDAKSFNEEDSTSEWRKSSLRKWLNEEFYNEAFTESERNYIVSDKDLDKITLLTKEQLDSLENDDKKAKITEYAKYKDVYGGVYGDYWLKTSANTIENQWGTFYREYVVKTDGTLYDLSVTDIYRGVRPVIKVSKDVLESVRKSEFEQLIEPIKDSFVNGVRYAEVGNVVTFGDYHGPIIWRVISKNNNQYLLMSEYAIDVNPFDFNRVSNDWKHSSLREWMNNEFYEMAFSTDEKSMILSRDDKVSILSKDEYDSLNDEVKIAKPTQNALRKKVKSSEQGADYWIRFVQSDDDQYAYTVRVNESGIPELALNNITNNYIGIRPVVLVNAEAGKKVSYMDESPQDRFHDQYLESLEEMTAIKPGIVKFGNYNGPLYWSFTFPNDGTIEMISVDIIEMKTSDNTYLQADWSSCSLRDWLNEEFLEEAFSFKERDMMAEVYQEDKVTIISDRIPDQRTKSRYSSYVKEKYGILDKYGDYWVKGSFMEDYVPCASYIDADGKRAFKHISSGLSKGVRPVIKIKREQ